MTDLSNLARQMRADSERWFPTTHAVTASIPLPVFYALGMAGEVGEVANDVKKLYRDNDDTPRKIIKIGAELADVLTYLLLLADELGIDIEDEYEKKREFNEARWGHDRA